VQPRLNRCPKYEAIETNVKQSLFVNQRKLSLRLKQATSGIQICAQKASSSDRISKEVNDQMFHKQHAVYLASRCYDIIRVLKQGITINS